jgi:quercetin dioxygenase-like cupin family protein
MKHVPSALAKLGLAALATASLALAGPAAAAASLAPSLAAPASGAAAEPLPGQGVRVAMRQETLPPGGRMAEHRSDGLRYVLVVSGRLKLIDLVTGEEQVVEAGRMAAERPGNWCTAQAVGHDPVTLYVIDRAIETTATP